MKKDYSLLSAIIVFIILTILLCLNLPAYKLSVSFLDILQGDSIYIRSPDDYGILIDAGPDTKVLEELAETMPLYYRAIDLIILTHPHSDHVNGFVEVLKRYKVNHALIVGTPSGNPFYQEFLKLLREKNINVHFVRADQDIRIGRDVFVDVIWPEKLQTGREYENLNNASVSLRLVYKDNVFLFTGDAETEEENEILNSGFVIEADILKAGHHGSRTASSDALLDAVTPEIVIIQSGTGNSYGHPHKETLLKYAQRGIEVLRNDLSGRITLEFF